jgi:hypothetical protein
MKLIPVVFLTSPISLTLRIRQPLVDVFSFLPFSTNIQHKISQESVFSFSPWPSKMKDGTIFFLKFEMRFYLNRNERKTKETGPASTIEIVIASQQLFR